MTSSRIAGGTGIRPRRIAAAVLAAIAAVAGVGALSGFHQQLREIDPQGPDVASEVASAEIIGIRTFTAAAGIDVQADLEYGTREDGTLLTLDVCSPPADVLVPTRPAVLSIHGGSWARGDKANADWRNTCLWLASEGFVAASVNYRLVPDVRFPAAIEDVALAVEWLRSPEQVERFGIDPARIGAFGGSAGGISRHSSARRARVRSTRAHASRPSPSSPAPSDSRSPTSTPTAPRPGCAVSSATTSTANPARPSWRVPNRRMPRPRSCRAASIRSASSTRHSGVGWRRSCTRISADTRGRAGRPGD